MNKIKIAPSTTLLNEKGELRVCSSYDFKGSLGELNEITEALIKEYGKDAECKIRPIVSSLDDSLHCEIVIEFDSIKNDKSVEDSTSKKSYFLNVVVRGFIIALMTMTILSIDEHYEQQPKLGWIIHFLIYWITSSAIIFGVESLLRRFINNK